MQNTIPCPSCRRELRVPDQLIGKLVKCPACATTFTASASEPSPPVEVEAEKETYRAQGPRFVVFFSWLFRNILHGWFPIGFLLDLHLYWWTRFRETGREGRRTSRALHQFADQLIRHPQLTPATWTGDGVLHHYSGSPKSVLHFRLAKNNDRPDSYWQADEATRRNNRNHCQNAGRHRVLISLQFSHLDSTQEHRKSN